MTKQFDLMKNQDDIPDVIWNLASYGHKEWKIPSEAHCIVNVGIYMRKAQMKIDPPSKQILCRIVLNYSYDETFVFQTSSKNGKRTTYATIKNVVVPSNNALILGPSMMCDHQLYVSSNPHVELTSTDFPKNIPKNIQQTIPGIPSYLSRNKTIRPQNYERITVVLDYQGTDEMLASFNSALLGGEQDTSLSFSNLISKLIGNSLPINIPHSKEGLTQFLKTLNQKKDDQKKDDQNKDDQKKDDQKK